MSNLRADAASDPDEPHGVRRVLVRDTPDHLVALEALRKTWREIAPASNAQEVALIVTPLEMHHAFVAWSQRLAAGAGKPILVPWKQPIPQLRPEAKMVSLLLRLARMGHAGDAWLQVVGSSSAPLFRWPPAAEKLEDLFEPIAASLNPDRDPLVWRRSVKLIVRDGTLAAFMEPLNGTSTDRGRGRATAMLTLIRDAMEISADRLRIPLINGNWSKVPKVQSLYTGVVEPKAAPQGSRPPVYLCLVEETDEPSRFLARVLGDALVGGEATVRTAVSALIGHRLHKCRHFAPWGKQAELSDAEGQKVLYKPDPAMKLEARSCAILTRRWLESAAASEGDADAIRRCLREALTALVAARGSAAAPRRAAVVIAQAGKMVKSSSGEFIHEKRPLNLEMIADEVRAIFRRRAFDTAIERGPGRGKRLKAFRRLYSSTADPQDWMSDRRRSGQAHFDGRLCLSAAGF